MDEEPSTYVILSTVFLYIFIGFSVGWIGFSYRFIKKEKYKQVSAKGKFQFLNYINPFHSTKDDVQHTPPTCIFEYERNAKEKLDPKICSLINDGATSMYTLRENTIAYSRYNLMPKYLVDVSEFSTKTTILGKDITTPIGISPVNFQKWVHPDGDIGTSQAALESGTIFVASAHAFTPLEEIASVTPDGIKWMQVYLYKPLEYTVEMVKAAEENGYSAIVVTVDSPVLGIMHCREKFTRSYPNINNISRKIGTEPPSHPSKIANPGHSWEQLKLIINQTKLPFVLKGILNAEDVKLAAEAGAKAILVSNHGGRVLDGVPSTIEVLEEITREAKQYQLEVYLDGGVRTGVDVFRAVALGAKMVFIGRPALWGLACDGKTGVRRVLEILSNEFKNTAQLCGAANINAINRDMIQYVGRG